MIADIKGVLYQVYDTLTYLLLRLEPWQPLYHYWASHQWDAQFFDSEKRSFKVKANFSFR